MDERVHIQLIGEAPYNNSLANSQRGMGLKGSRRTTWEGGLLQGDPSEGRPGGQEGGKNPPFKGGGSSKGREAPLHQKEVEGPFAPREGKPLWGGLKRGGHNISGGTGGDNRGNKFPQGKSTPEKGLLNRNKTCGALDTPGASRCWSTKELLHRETIRGVCSKNRGLLRDPTGRNTRSPENDHALLERRSPLD